MAEPALGATRSRGGVSPPGSPRSAPGLTSSSERGGLSGGKARRSQHLVAPRELPPPSCRAEGGSFPRWGAGGGRKQCPGSRVRGGTSPGSCGLAGRGRGFPAPWCLQKLTSGGIHRGCHPGGVCLGTSSEGAEGHFMCGEGLFSLPYTDGGHSPRPSLRQCGGPQ